MSCICSTSTDNFQWKTFGAGRRRLERTAQSGTELRWVLGMELLEGRPERTWAQSETLNLDLTAGEASRTQQNGTSLEVGLSCRKIKPYFLLP